MIDIKRILKRENEKYEHDSILKPEVYYKVGVETEVLLPMIKKYFIAQEFQGEQIRVLRSVEEFVNLYREWLPLRNYENFLNELLVEQNEISVCCYCEICGKVQPMIVEKNGEMDCNWRESLICPDCRCGNHKRFLAGKVWKEYHSGMRIFLYEKDTQIYDVLAGKIPEITGVKFIPEAENLTMDQQDEVYSIVLANDVFERAADYKLVLKETARIIKPGGKLIFTTIFDANSNESRGNVFGWELLNELLASGYSDAYAVADYSINDGYMSYIPLYFEAIK